MSVRYPGDKDGVRRRNTGNKRCKEPVLHLHEQGWAVARQGNTFSFSFRFYSRLFRRQAKFYFIIDTFETITTSSIWLNAGCCLVYPSQRIYNENCNFKEIFLENYFNAYSSAKWTKNGKEMFIALSQKGRPMRGKKTRREHIASHFIPMKCREEERRVDWQSRGLLTRKLCMYFIRIWYMLTDTCKLITIIMLHSAPFPPLLRCAPFCAAIPIQ